MAKHTVVDIAFSAENKSDSKVMNLLPAIDMDNGSHVVMSSTPLKAGEIDCYNVVAPTDVTKQLVMLMYSPEIVEVNGYRVGILGNDGIANFFNPANRVAGGYIMETGDPIVMTIDGFSSTPTVGQYVIPQNGSTKLAPATSPDGARLAYLVTRKETINIGNSKSNRVEAYRLVVVKAN